LNTPNPPLGTPLDRVTGRRGIKRKQLLDDIKEMREYFKLKEEALDHIPWRTRFGRCYGDDVRQTADCAITWK